MLFSLSFRLHFVALSALSLAQQSVPQDLAQSFQPQTVDLQVSYTGDASNGFLDGSRFTGQQVANAPTFGMGDSSGVSTVANFAIMMVDTTCPQRVIHFMQPSFKSSGDRLRLASQAAPLINYIAPGSRGEKGLRQYTFLMFLQPSTARFNSVPQAGDVIDVVSVQTANGLRPAIAGLSMQVNLEGTADCSNNGGGRNGGGQQPPPPAVVQPPVQNPPQRPTQVVQQPPANPPIRTTLQVQQPPAPAPTPIVIVPGPANPNPAPANPAPADPNPAPANSQPPSPAPPRGSAPSSVSFTAPINLGPIPTGLLASTASLGSAGPVSTGPVQFEGAGAQLRWSTWFALGALGLVLGW